MSRVQENVPEALRRDVDAAVAWFSRERQTEFEVTGIVDPDASLATDRPRDLRLVLCGGGLCEQRTFRVSSDARGLVVALHAEIEPAPGRSDPAPAELDPPPGARRSWLDAVLAQHAFVVLVFYRGFW